MRYILLALLIVSCSTPKFSQDTIIKAKEIHNEVITLDTHVDIDTDYFEKDKHLGMNTSNQVDLPKMRKGGLDAAFFIVYTAQYLRNKEGYDQSYQRAKEMFAAIRRMTNKYNKDEIMLVKNYADIAKATKKK